MLNQWPVIVGDWSPSATASLARCVVEDPASSAWVIILNGARIGRRLHHRRGTLIPEETVIPPGSLVMAFPQGAANSTRAAAVILR